MVRWLVRVNEARRGLPAYGPDPAVPGLGDPEAALDRPSTRLAVYGSLAPGRENHRVLAHLPGSWDRGSVRGELYPSGWGSALGYPGLVWIPRAAAVPVHVLTSEALPRQWARIDAFEGEAYRRILVPVEETSLGVLACNLYELRVPP